MYILAIETTGKYGSVAIADESGRTWVANSDNEMNHLRDIISLCDEAITRAGITKRDLTHIACSVGPGSFTGIRIGVTTARTIAQMLDLPCIPISSLEAMAARSLDYAVKQGAGYIVSAIDARRHQVYGAIWKVLHEDGNSIEAYLEQKQYIIEDVALHLSTASTFKSERVLLTGDGIDAYEDILSARLSEVEYIFASKNIRYQNANEVALLGLKRAKAGETVSYEELMPEYIRLSEAEQRMRDGSLSEKIKQLQAAKNAIPTRQER